MADRHVGDQFSRVLPGTQQHEQHRHSDPLLHQQHSAKGVGSGNELGSTVASNTGTLGGTGGDRRHIPGLPIHTVEDQKITGVANDPHDHTGVPGHVDYLGGREGFTGTTAHDPWKGKSAHVGTHIPTSTKIASYIPGTQANKAKKAGLISVKPGEGQTF